MFNRANLPFSMCAMLTDGAIDGIVAQIPDSWLQTEPSFADATAYRSAYASYLKRRLLLREAFVQEAIRAHAAYL